LKHLKIFIVILIIGLIIQFIILNFVNSVVNEVRPVSEKFMNNLQTQNFNDAKKILKSNINLEKLFCKEGVIYNFKEVGFGANSMNNVNISYYVTGLPSETCNVFINYQKEKEQWYIKNLKVTYHINRKDKQNVLNFISGNINKTYNIVKGMSNKKLFEIKNIILNYKIEDWKIIKAINKPYLGKNIKVGQNKTKIHIQTTDKKVTLYFHCVNQKAKHWIDKIEIINK